MRESDPENSLCSPAADLLDAARSGERSREHPVDPRMRYALLQKRFEEERSMDALGLRQAVLELRSPSAIYPPRPRTLRGRVGHWIVRGQARALWWLLRAFDLHTHAMEAVYETLRSEHQRVTAIREKYAADAAAFEKRLRNLERRAGIDARGEEGD